MDAFERAIEQQNRLYVEAERRRLEDAAERQRLRDEQEARLAEPITRGELIEALRRVYNETSDETACNVLRALKNEIE